MLTINNLSKKIGNKLIIDDLSFAVKPGEVTGLVGVNGSGKTTTLKCIAGLQDYHAGTILVDDKEIVQEEGKIGYIADFSNLPHNYTVEEAMSFMETFYPHWNRQRAEEIREFFNLELDSKLSMLSKGNLAKANMMFGLAQDVDYLILDEPFAGIDVFTREKILETFYGFIQDNCGVLITTHELYEVENFIDRVVLIDDGKVIGDKYLEDVRYESGLSLVEWLRKEMQL